MNIDMNALFTSLDILWKGLLAISIVIIAIMVVTMIMNGISRSAQTKKEQAEKQNQQNE